MEENVRTETSDSQISARSLVQTVKMSKCPFPGLVEISLKRFQDNDLQFVECLGRGRMRTLFPSKGVIRFKPHEKRKVNTPNTEKRWVKGKPDWDMVGR